MEKQRFKIKFFQVIVFVVVINAVWQIGGYFHKAHSGFPIEASSQEITNVEFFLGQSNMDISQILQADPVWFSPERKRINPDYDSTWVKITFAESRPSKENAIFLTNEFLEIKEAFSLSNKRAVAIPIGNNHIYSYAEMPAEAELLYLRVGDLRTNYHMALRSANKQAFFLSQNRLLIYRTGCIAVIAVVFFMNLVLYRFDGNSGYSTHALLLLIMIFALIQDSGLQKLVIGFNDFLAAYVWGFMTSMAAMYINYNYFGIRTKLPGWPARIYRILIGMHIVFICAVNFIRISAFSDIVTLFLLVVCTIGFMLSIYASKSNTKKLPQYFFAMVVLTFMATGAYILGLFGAVPWNLITANSIYLLWATEAASLTIVIFNELNENKKMVQRLKNEATTDPLTGLFNRNYFEKVIISKISALEENTQNLSLLLIDIDHFKDVNDTFGHNMGDAVLKELSVLMARTIRHQDELIRWGGEEFIVVTYEADFAQATKYAESIRKTIDEHNFQYTQKVTVSIGVAEKLYGEAIDSWIKRADDSLYRAKNNGRNRVS